MELDTLSRAKADLKSISIHELRVELDDCKQSFRVEVMISIHELRVELDLEEEKE